MKLICFNINGIRARQHQLETLKEKYNPDFIGLQETKVHNEQFPFDQTDAIGMHAEIHGQKSHYGVASLTKAPPLQVQKGFPADNEESQRRFIHVTIEFNGKPLHILNGYFPQGENRSHETKFPAKEKFYSDLMNYLNEKFTKEDQVIVMGDMNISPEDIDIGIGPQNQKRWLKQGKCSFLPEEREWLERLKNWGLTDSFRMLNQQVDDRYSWFDYRSKGFDDDPKRGLRIDLVMVSDNLKDHCKEAGILYDIRGMEKPSDHAPIYLDLE